MVEDNLFRKIILYSTEGFHLVFKPHFLAGWLDSINL